MDDEISTHNLFAGEFQRSLSLGYEAYQKVESGSELTVRLVSYSQLD
jgi:hypothetical protein